MRRLRALLAGVLLACCAAGAPAADAPLRLAEAEFVLHEGAAPPAPGAAWQRVPLPDVWTRTRPAAKGVGWYRFAFRAAEAPREPWLVYLTRFRDGGEVFLNGELLASVRRSDAEHYVRWMRPFAFTVPPAQLRPGENVLHVRVVADVYNLAMSSVTVGAEAQVRPQYELRHLLAYTSAQITAVVSVVVAAFVIAIWIRRRMAFDYGLFGLGVLFWGIRTVSFVVEVYPLWFWHAWRVAHYAATGGFVIAMTLFMMRFAGMRRAGVERLLVLYWPSGPLLLLAGGPGWHEFVDRYYQAGLIAVAMLMVGVTLYAGWRQRTPGALALCGAVLVAIAMGVHDYLLSQRVVAYESLYTLHFAADALLVVVGVLLADRFVTSLREAEEGRATLADKVAQKERELSANFERLRGYERERTVADERQRIMQDMHDGLGSQLLTSLAMVERGALDREGMARVLREAIDDMRLAIDTLSPGRAGLLEALGNLRYRVEPRFRAAGLELRFVYRDLPEQLELPQEAALQILRMLQEALTNTLKHARARAVGVEVALLSGPARLALDVADDGAGFDVAAPAVGRGLASMRRRAQGIGASLEISSGPRGTRVSIAYPLSRSA